MLGLTLLANAALQASITVHFSRIGKVKRAESIQNIDKELRTRLTSEPGLQGGSGILQAAEIVVVDQLEPAIVPDAALEDVIAQRCLAIRAIMLLG